MFKAKNVYLVAHKCPPPPKKKKKKKNILLILSIMIFAQGQISLALGCLAPKHQRQLAGHPLVLNTVKCVMKLHIHSKLHCSFKIFSRAMDKQYHSTFYWECDYLSMLGLKLIPSVKWAPSGPENTGNWSTCSIILSFCVKELDVIVHGK